MRPDDDARRARWGLALVAASAVLAFGSFWARMYDPAARPAPAAIAAVLAGAGGLLPLLAVASLVVGVVQLVRGVFPSPVRANTAEESAAVQRPAVSRRVEGGTAAVALTGLSLLALVAIGAVELLVWGPLSMAPGYSLDQIYALLSEPDREWGVRLIVVWIAFWAVAAMAYLAVGLVTLRRMPRVRIRHLVAVGLLLASVIVFFQFWAGFSLGMSISDTIPPYAGGTSPAGYLYALAGQLSLVAAIVLGIVPAGRRAPVAA